MTTRPTAVTVVCTLGFIGSICMIGLWNMKKWAAYAYTGFTVLTQIVMIAIALGNVSKME